MRAATCYRLVAALLLAGIAGQRYATARRPLGLDAYQQRIAAAAAAVPHHIGSWVGQDVHVPSQAMSKLKPNVIISRRYLNVETGATAGFLLVHCSDAHDMAGHYPLRCYPADGWRTVGSAPREWQVGNLHLAGTEYEFVMDDLDQRGSRSIIVANCLLRPGGLVLPDMNAMARSIIGAGGESTGAGQIQVYFDSTVPRQQRDEAIATLVGGYRPAIDAILSKPR